MRHKKSGRRLGRNSAHRKAMFRNMVTSLMEHGRIQTTEAKAKELRRIADRIITLGKRVPPSSLEGMSGEDLVKARARRLHNIRRASSYLRNQNAVALVFNEYSERFKDRPGGYTRIVKTGYRAGDNAPMAVIELVGDMPSEDDEVAEDAEVATEDGAADAFFEEGEAAETPAVDTEADNTEAVEDEATE